MILAIDIAKRTGLAVGLGPRVRPPKGRVAALIQALQINVICFMLYVTCHMLLSPPPLIPPS